jgi:hypothetical protein
VDRPGGRDGGAVTTARLFHVDAFATALFTGNPAAVLVLDQPPGDGLGPRIGAEFNQPATAVAWPTGQEGCAFPSACASSRPACNYTDYQVTKSFRVDAGPIAPWSGQPGGGIQFQLDGALVTGAPAQLNVMWMVAHGYLTALPG